MSDYDRENWQAEQIARDEAQGVYRDKMTRARERSAANAKRKIARLHAKLTELGHISDFEDEFGESVLERLDKFGSAFNDREKGRAGDALSMAQKQVVACMNKKVKDLKAKQAAGQGLEPDPDADYVRTADRWKQESQESQKRNGFKSKRSSKFTPRVRQIEDEIIEDTPPTPPIYVGPPKLVSVPATLKDGSDSYDKGAEPYIPEYVSPAVKAVPSKPESVKPTPSKLTPSKLTPSKPTPSKPTGAKRPFLRLVPKAE